MDESTQSETPPQLKDRLDLGEHVLATRTSEASEGVDTAEKNEIYFWALRHPLSPSSPGEERFLQRLAIIQELARQTPNETTVPLIRFYGVEKSGLAYAVTDFVQGIPLPMVDADVELHVKLFLRAVAAVASLHQREILLGDICEESFLVEQDASVRLVAFLGSFEVEARGTAQLPPTSTLPFLSPEQRGGMSSNLTCDVFALGILGYRLFTGRFPFGERVPVNAAAFEELLSAAPSPSTLRADLPIWIDDILGRCLETNSTDRYRDAVALSEALRQSNDLGYAVDGGGRWAKRTVMVRPKSDGVLTQRPIAEANEFADKESEAPVQKTPPAKAQTGTSLPAKALLIAASGLAIGVVVAGVLFVGGQGGGLFGKSTSQFDWSDFAPPELQPVLTDLRSSSVSVEQKLVALRTLALSTNPVAFTFLTEATMSDLPPEVKTESYRLLVEKLRALKLTRSADVLNNAISAAIQQRIDPSKVPAYPSLLRACDISLPIEARKEAIHKAFADDKPTTLQLAGALSIDDTNPQHFVPVLRQLLTSSGSVGDLSGKGVGALILSNRLLTLTFDRDILAMLPSFSPLDLAWAMSKLAETDSPLLYDLATETLKRNIVPPYQTVFLSALNDSDRFATPRAVRVSLVRAAQGQISSNDVSTLAGWLDISAEPALLAICALTSESQIALEAFEALSVRALRTEPGNALVTWAMKSYLDHRDKLVKPIGILAHSKIATTDQVNFAFDQLMPYSASGTLFGAITKSREARLIEVSIHRMSVIVATQDLIKLLDFPDKAVKIAAIEGLKERNDITDLQRIIAGYKKETDEEVRETYRKNLWVISDRERRGVN